MARQATCLSNNRQYSLATLMYVQDYDETYPQSAFMNGTCVATFYWAVHPYVKNDQIIQCPSEREAMRIADLVGFPCPNTPTFNSYAVNHALFTNGFFGLPPVSLGAVNRPADTVMTYDGNVTFGQAPGQQVQLAQARHNGNFVANYADGHAKAVQAKEDGRANQFTVFGPGKELKVYRIGANGGFYRGMVECLGIPE